MFRRTPITRTRRTAVTSTPARWNRLSNGRAHNLLGFKLGPVGSGAARPELVSGRGTRRRGFRGCRHRGLAAAFASPGEWQVRSGYGGGWCQVIVRIGDDPGRGLFVNTAASRRIYPPVAGAKGFRDRNQRTGASAQARPRIAPVLTNGWTELFEA
jgi:hypothetical protein